MTRLALLLACLVAGPVALAQTEVVRGLTQSNYGSDVPLFVRFEVHRADSSVVIQSLGRQEVFLLPTGRPPEIQAMPDSSKAIRISHASFLRIANSVEGTLAPVPGESVFSVTIDDGDFRLAFNRAAPVRTLGVTLGIVALGLVLGSVGGTAWILLRRGRERERRDAESRRRQIEAGEAERARIARDIHDGPLQDLHAVRARASILDAEATAAFTEDVGAVARELRAIAEGLRPPALGRFGLAAALSSHAARFVERHPEVNVRVRADEDLPDLNKQAEASIFRVIQEALTNSVRHGGARHVDVTVQMEPSSDMPVTVAIRVADDGRGIAQALDFNLLASEGHFGLSGMRERADLLGGTFDVVSQGEGVLIALDVPLDAISEPA